VDFRVRLPRSEHHHLSAELLLAGLLSAEIEILIAKYLAAKYLVVKLPKNVDV